MLYKKYPEIHVESINATKNGGSHLEMSTGRSYFNFGTPCISNFFLKKCALIEFYPYFMDTLYVFGVIVNHQKSI